MKKTLIRIIRRVADLFETNDVDSVVKTFNRTTARLDRLSKRLIDDNQRTLAVINAGKARIDGNVERITRAALISTRIKELVG